MQVRGYTKYMVPPIPSGHQNHQNNKGLCPQDTYQIQRKESSLYMGENWQTPFNRMLTLTNQDQVPPDTKH